MDTNLNTISLPDFTSLVELKFHKTAKDITPVARQLFQVDEVGLNNGEFRMYKEFDRDNFASSKPQGQNTAKGKGATGYQKQATVRRFGTEIDITDEMRKFNKYPEVINELTNLAHYPRLREELDLTHRITFANATSYVDRDGNTIDISTGETSATALASASHALKYSSTTYSNIVSGNPAFSKAGLEAAELIAMTQIFNNFGEKDTKDFNTIFCAENPTVINTIKELLNSTATVTANQNSGVTNVYKNAYNLVVLPYLATSATGGYDSSKRNWWGLVATGVGAGAWQAYLAIWEKPYLVTPMTTPSLVDGHADVWTYGVRTSYDIAVVSARGFIISMAS